MGLCRMNSRLTHFYKSAIKGTNGAFCIVSHLQRLLRVQQWVGGKGSCTEGIQLHKHMLIKNIQSH